MVQDAGGKVTTRVVHDDLIHIILSPAIWAREGTASASQLVKNVKAANEQNDANTPPYADRAWIMPLEWVEESIAANKRLPEVKYDYELQEAANRAKRSREIAEENAQYRRKHGKKAPGLYARGERKRLETECRREEATIMPGLS
ncbi:BQ2448_649 [Microbotryum intermedium]|uniref:BQ2448_649 protein n=1 Tax=Microbotryum intermedium TaxID=269621 RepID=A0A238FBL2_9BASI|nr:BQ2448_649 [Microbotryum intermedium]